MATNKDPRAAVILQTALRPAADRMARLYFDLKELRSQSFGQNWGSAFPGSPDDAVDDGGTIQCTNYQALAVLSVVDSLLAVFEANGNQDLTILLSARKV